MGEESLDVLDKLAEDELILLLGTLKEPACLPGETFLPGDLAFPFKDTVLFLWMEWAMTPDPLPVYSLSPIDMVITIWGTRLLSSTTQCSQKTGSQVTRCGTRHGLQ